MACKFNVGDVVRLVENHDGRKKGEMFTVTGDDGSMPYIVYVVDRKGKKFDAFERRFELVRTTPEIHITVNGNETIAVYKNGIETKKAVAKCSPEDTFDFNIGAKIALERLGVLAADPVEEPKTVGNNVKFKTGDFAKIIGNKSGHHFEIGTIVKLEKGYHDYKAMANGDYWYVIDADLEAYTVGNTKDKYEVGDRVICEKSNVEEMHKFAGLVGTIIRVWDTGCGHDYLIDFAESGDTNKVWCKVKCLAPEKDSGKTPDPKANVKPTKSTKPTNDLYNGYVVCTESESEYNFWTIGKIYQIVDGVITDDNGDKHYDTSNHPLKSFEQLTRRSLVQFIEIKK